MRRPTSTDCDATRAERTSRPGRGYLVANSSGVEVKYRSKVRGYVAASHPGPTLVVTAATTALAVAAGRASGSWWVAGAVLAGQCSVGWSNDAIDAQRDQRVQRASKPIVSLLVTRREIGTASLVAFMACIVLSLASGWRAALIHLAAVTSAIAYNAGLKATVLSPLPYAFSFGLLPAFVTWGLPVPAWPAPIVMFATAAIGVGAHMVNAVADIDDDAANNVRGLPQRLGSRRALEVGTLLLLFAGVLVAVHSPRHVVAFALVAVAAVIDVTVFVAGATGRARLAWRLALLQALLCVAIFIVGGGSLVTSR